MNELQLIVDAYAAATARGERAALATVVSVEGSAYRRPGARMLITETGATSGTISGGCLERDVIEHAQRIMASGEPALLEYDTRGDEESVWGLGMGCNGLVRVMVESFEHSVNLHRTLQFIGRRLRSHSKGVIALVVNRPPSTTGAAEFGTRFFFCDEELADEPEFPDPRWYPGFLDDARRTLAERRCGTRKYANDGAEVFFDVIHPPRKLMIFGAEQDAIPVVRLAKALGWEITVVDVKNRPATPERFAEADRVVLCRAEEVSRKIRPSRETAVVMMTHSYFDDVELLKTLLPARTAYLGLLGPAQRTAKLLAELERDGVVTTVEQLERLHAPIGVDIGAETADEIALSILAEIKAVDAGRGAGYLRERRAPIHGEAEVSLPVPVLAPFAPALGERHVALQLVSAAVS